MDSMLGQIHAAKRSRTDHGLIATPPSNVTAAAPPASRNGLRRIRRDHAVSAVDWPSWMERSSDCTAPALTYRLCGSFSRQCSTRTRSAMGTLEGRGVGALLRMEVLISK